ncbi:MFS transporter [Rhodococcus hoagii]|nr:MFS transporter [Prescottella equi]
MLPALPGLLGVSAGSASWLVTATLVTGAVVTPLIGRLADMFGKKRMIMLTLVVVVVGSAMGGLFTALPALVIARILQGCGLALVPVAIATMRDVLPAERVPGGVSAMGASLAIGSAAGLPLAGVLVNYLDWRGIFWVTAGCGVLLTAAVARIVPGDLTPLAGALRLCGSAPFGGRVDIAAAGAVQGRAVGVAGDDGAGRHRGPPHRAVGAAPTTVAFATGRLEGCRTAQGPAGQRVVRARRIRAGQQRPRVHPAAADAPRGRLRLRPRILEAGLWMIPPTLVGVAMAPVAARAITRYARGRHC